MPKSIRLFLVLVAGFLAFVSAPKTYSAQTCTETKGTVTRESYRSLRIATNMVFSVYTPPCYNQTDQLYPVVYLMHGSNEDDGEWIRLGLTDLLDQGITAGTLPPMIVVLPFGNWVANKNQFSDASWENVFLNEMMPLAESRYRVDARPEMRAIGGISRGGFWAFEIAFRHPQLFSALGGHSAFFDPGNAPPDFNPLDLAVNADGLDGLRIELDRGKDDYAAPGLDLMDQKLTERGIAHQYTVYPEGQHYSTYWQQHVAEYIAFYAAGWQNQPVAPTPVPFATNTPNTPTAEATPDSDSDKGYDLFVPAVAFPSLQTIINFDQLRDLVLGYSDPRFILNSSTAAALQNEGVKLNPATLVVPDDSLLNIMWKDRTLYTVLAFNHLTPRYRMLHTELNGAYQRPYQLPGQLILDEPNLDFYPFIFPSEHPNFYPNRLTRLLLSGVTALTRLTREALDKNGVKWAEDGIKGYVESSDFFHTSNEVSFSPDCPQSTTPTLGEFCSKEVHFDLLTDLGLDIVELTGNHNNDYGTDNYLKTLDWYRQHGIQTIGGGENLEQAQQPLLLNHHGNHIVMLACNWAGPYYALAGDDSPGAAYCDWDWLRATLPKLKAENDVVVVTVQYKEYEDYKPTPQQELDFRALADLGADVVIGTQAHKPQTFEFYNAATGEQSFIHYGMGNLFFDQPFWGNSRFFMDQLFIYDGKLLTVDLFTGIIDDLARPRPMTADEQLNFLAFMFNTQGGL